MNKSTKFLLASVSPVALAAGWAVLDSAPAHATLTVTGAAISYASENFVGASASTLVIVTSTAFSVASGSTTTDFGVGSITFTLSNGATFAAAPSATRTTNLTIGSGTLSSTSTAVTYAVTSIGSTTSSTITLGNFTVSGIGTRLATSSQGITITYSSTVGSNNPTVPSATLAVGAQAYIFTGTSSAVTIDLANSGAGLAFRSGSSNVTFATLGTLCQAAAAAANDVSGAAIFTATSSDSLRAIINGNLSTFSSIYAASAACAATAPSGALTGTIATNQLSATISPLVQASVYNICAVTNGTSIIPSGTITGVAQITFASRTVSGATYTPGAYSQTATTVATLAYNGSTATAFYVVGLGSYISAIRVTNTNATSSGSVFVQVTPDSTGTPVRALLDSTLASGQSKFYLASDIRTAVGTAVLTDSNNRATVVFLTSFTGLRLQNFIVNPGGVLSGGTSNDGTSATGN